MDVLVEKGKSWLGSTIPLLSHGFAAFQQHRHELAACRFTGSYSSPRMLEDDAIPAGFAILASDRTRPVYPDSNRIQAIVTMPFTFARSSFQLPRKAQKHVQ
jgi:hypothetical protein